jgi:hypothetical protein
MIKSQHTAKTFSKEAQLYDPVARFLRNQGFRLQLPEVPFYEYRIDLYSFCKKTDITVAVELKLTDWRRAFEQALLYQLCSDLVYVAMPERSANRVVREDFVENGIGLIAVQDSGKCQLLVQAIEHSEVRLFYRRSQIEYLKDYACAP